MPGRGKAEDWVTLLCAAASGQKFGPPLSLADTQGWGIMKYWLIQSLAKWEWKFSLPLDLPDTTLAGELEQCLTLLKRLAPHWDLPMLPSREIRHQLLLLSGEMIFHLYPDFTPAEKSEHPHLLLGVGEGGRDKRGMENQLPVWPQWNYRKTGSFSVGVWLA